MAENHSKATPAKVLFLFTLLFAGVTAAAWRESSAQVGEMEMIDYPTALGDEQWCPVSLLQMGTQFTASLDGQKSPVKLEITSPKGLKRNEEKLWKTGLDESGSFYVYGQAGAEKSTLWVKSAPQLFYEVKLAPP